MSFGPWMNSEDEIDYVSSATEETLTAWDEHMQWKLISAFVTKKEYSIVSKDKKFVTKFPNLIYYFVIERHSSLITKVILGWFIDCSELVSSQKYLEFISFYDFRRELHSDVHKRVRSFHWYRVE